MFHLVLALAPAYWQTTVLKLVVIMLTVVTGAFILVYGFLFKMMAHMQSRLGPMEAGPHGLLQLMAEFGKFLQKEDIFPSKADRRVFALAPFVVLSSTFLVYLVIPAGPRLVVEDFDTGIFFAMAMSSLSVLGVLMAGWASANKYSLIGALRAAGQLIAYELPLVLAIVGVVVQSESLSLQTIVHKQADGAIFGFSGLGNPFILTSSSGS